MKALRSPTSPTTHAADDRPQRRTETLGGLHEPNRLRHPPSGADSAAIASESAP